MTPRHITVLDVFRDLQIEPEPRATWAVGAAVRDIYVAETGQLPPKGLRNKTFGPGSHCFALYPPEWRYVIERQILAHTTTQQRQGDLLAPAPTQAHWPSPHESQNTTFVWWLNSPPVDANREARALDRRLVVEPETEEAERQRRLRALEDWVTEERRPSSPSRATCPAPALPRSDWLWYHDPTSSESEC